MIDERLRVAEGRIERLRRELAAGEDAIRALKQGLRAAMMMRGQGGGGSPAGPLFCVLTGALAAASALPSGAPTSIGSQTIYSIDGGAFTEASTDATLYNGMPVQINSGALVMALPNTDGSYTVVAVNC